MISELSQSEKGGCQKVNFKNYFIPQNQVIFENASVCHYSTVGKREGVKCPGTVPLTNYLSYTNSFYIVL